MVSLLHLFASARLLPAANIGANSIVNVADPEDAKTQSVCLDLSVEYGIADRLNT